MLDRRSSSCCTLLDGKHHKIRRMVGIPCYTSSALACFMCVRLCRPQGGGAERHRDGIRGAEHQGRSGDCSLPEPGARASPPGFEGAVLTNERRRVNTYCLCYVYFGDVRFCSQTLIGGVGYLLVALSMSY